MAPPKATPGREWLAELSGPTESVVIGRLHGFTPMACDPTTIICVNSHAALSGRTRGTWIIVIGTKSTVVDPPPSGRRNRLSSVVKVQLELEGEVVEVARTLRWTGVRAPDVPRSLSGPQTAAAERIQAESPPFRSRR